MGIKLSNQTFSSRLFRIIGSPMKFLLKPAIMLVLPLSLAAGQALAVDLGIENDAEYTALVSAMRAAEYVRSDIIVSETPKPRVYATLAGVMAFAERNPNASEAQLTAFLYIFNAALSNFAEGDPNLNERANLYSGLRFAIVEATLLDESIFDGTDTKIGLRALELIGVIIPNTADFNTMQSRMIDFEISLGRPLDYRNEIFDLLVSGFFGQDPSGLERPGLPAILDTYFESEGFNPELGGTRAELSQIDAGLALLPADFIAYEQAISEGSANMALRDIVMTQLNGVRESITAIVGVQENIEDGTLYIAGTLKQALNEAPRLVESVDLSLNNPAYVEGVLDTHRAELEATAQARAATSSATYLMLQSDDSTVEAYASFTRDYSQITLETNEQMADSKAQIKLVSTLAVGLIGSGMGNPEIVIASLASVGGQMLEMAFDQVAAPSVDEQTFAQLIELRQQVEAMRQEMNVRFDRIDKQLNTMTLVIKSGFDGIGEKLQDLDNDVSGLVRNMAAARSQLRRLEASLYGVAANVLLQELTITTNLALNLRADDGEGLQYGGGVSTSFTSASSIFDSFATVESKKGFAGSQVSPTVTLSDAQLLIGGDSFSSYLNDLAVLPIDLGLSSLAPSAIAGIEPWSQAASAYAQLARENPWYFGYRYGFGAKTELERIIQTGEQFVHFIDAIRDIDSNGNSALFEALIQNYRDTASQFQAELDNATTAILPDQFKNGSAKLNIWSGSPQLDLLDVIGPLDVFYPGDGTVNNLVIPSDTSFQGWGTFTDSGNANQAALLQTMVLLEKEKRYEAGLDPEDIRPTIRYEKFYENRYAIHIYFEKLTFDNSEAPRVKRYLRFYAEQYFNFGNFVGWYGFEPSDIEDTFLYVWNYQLKNELPKSRDTLSSGLYTRGDKRLRFYDLGVSTDPITADQILPGLHGYRARVRTDLLTMLLDEPSSALSLAANKLDQAVAILNAYVSIGMSKELGQSQLLRSALRAKPGTSELGLGSMDVITLIGDMDEADNNPQAWADQSFNVTKIEAFLNERLDTVAEEIKRGLQNPAVTPGYVGWVLAELNHLESTALDLAVNDTYIANGSRVMNMSAEEGLLINDVDQPELTISIDLELVSTPEHGTLILNEDGSFTYQADPGFIGTDSFQYQSTAINPGWNIPAFSNPATVVVIVLAPDFDDDGIVDSNDNCPAHPNPEQLNTDNDNLGNSCDDDDDEDGMSDEYEIANGLNSLVDDSEGDADEDGLTNLEEFTARSSSMLSDTDGDGLSDFDEVTTHGTNPALADTDGDGMTDDYELAEGLNPLDGSDCPSWMCGSSKIWMWVLLRDKP
jgi:hypothetical protein